MLAIKNPFDIGSIKDDHIRNLVIERFTMLHSQFPESYNPAAHGWFLIIEVDDELADCQSLGCPLLLTDFDAVPFGDPRYSNPYEFCIDHGGCFELVRVISDYGEAVAIFVPKSPAIAESLLQLCCNLSGIPS